MKKVNFRSLAALAAGIMLSAGSLNAQDAAPAQQNPIAGFFPLIVIFVIFYFFLIRPQQKRAKEHQAMVNALKKDDKIITSGGIYGTVSAVKGDTVEVKIADNVRIIVAKTAITTVNAPESAETVTPEVVK